MAAELILTTEIANDCLLCGCRPVDETTRDRQMLPMIHQIGGDVNWGDQVNICQVCAGVIADLMDRPAKEKVEKLQKKYDTLKADHDALVEEHKEQRIKIDHYVKGRKAEKELVDA